MELHNLKPAKGSVKKDIRKGRGEGSKRGGTATRGHKGAKSRSGYSRTPGFEGGQMPLYRRVPKFGFTNINRVAYQAVNLDTLQKLIDDKKVNDVITFDDFVALGLVGKRELLKVLGRGELKSPVTVYAHKFSKKAKEAIEAAGGKVELI
jgi:large subunit ribosomal protein L15